MSEYVGCGAVADLFAVFDAGEQQERHAKGAEWRQEREREEAIDRELDAIGAEIKTLLQGVLLINGYHTHKGQWRRHRKQSGRQRTPTTIS